MTQQETSLEGLKLASCELAENILGAMNKDVLAAAWIRRGKYDDVINLYGNLPSKGGDPDALNNLGIALNMKCATVSLMIVSRPKQECIEDAIAKFHQALASRWKFPEAHYSLGNTLFENDRYDLALTPSNALPPSWQPGLLPLTGLAERDSLGRHRL